MYTYISKENTYTVYIYISNVDIVMCHLTTGFHSEKDTYIVSI